MEELEGFVQGLVWSLGLAATVMLGIMLAPALGAVIGELGYWTERTVEWIVGLPSRVLARARADR